MIVREPIIVFCDECGLVQYLDGRHPHCTGCENTLYSIDVPTAEEIKAFKAEQKLKRSGE